MQPSLAFADAERLAKIETVDNGKAVRESMAADLPLVIDHFRYFAGVIRAEEGTATEIDANTLSLCIQEPLGVVGQIIPWNFPLLMATWKLAPALAAGNAVVLKPAEQTPTSIMALMELLQDVVPPGVINVVTGYGSEAGEALATHTGIAKLAFTGWVWPNAIVGAPVRLLSASSLPASPWFLWRSRNPPTPSQRTPARRRARHSARHSARQPTAAPAVAPANASWRSHRRTGPLAPARAS